MADAKQEQRERREPDKELQAMQRICRIMDELPIAAQFRALEWFAARMGCDLIAKGTDRDQEVDTRTR